MPLSVEQKKGIKRSVVTGWICEHEQLGVEKACDLGKGEDAASSRSGSAADGSREAGRCCQAAKTSLFYFGGLLAPADYSE